MMDDKLYCQMQDEYVKGGKFTDYVNKACRTYGDSVDDELKKAIVQEYYRSVTEGVNKE